MQTSWAKERYFAVADMMNFVFFDDFETEPKDSKVLLSLILKSHELVQPLSKSKFDAPRVS